MDLYLLLQSIQHLSPYLTNLYIQDWDISLKKSVDKLLLQMPDLKNFTIVGNGLGNQAFCNLPKVFAQERSNENKLDLKFNNIFIPDTDTLVYLLGSLNKVAEGTKIHLSLNIRNKINVNLLVDKLCEFFQRGKSKGVISIEICDKKINTKCLNRLEDAVQNSSISAKLKV